MRRVMRLYPLIRPLAFALDAETAHRATIAALKLMPPRRAAGLPGIAQDTVAGLDFPTPVGLAAGFDKDAEVPEQMLALGFGFVEVGTVTPRPQPGNPRPRLFRLSRRPGGDQPHGLQQSRPAGGLGAADRVHAHARGRSASTSAPTRTAPTASPIMSRASGRWRRSREYLTINISSPNTPGLRGLQDEGALDELLAAVQRGAGANERRSS